ncbi:PLDc N-terminal domain-containing protein [Christiangramia portivictoriae]|uniref:PLDc N-terminal domain-containing protein n=1 Tax=Christiangramia portivictoriae TaxID=326069 RepID=UPI00041AB74E
MWSIMVILISILVLVLWIWALVDISKTSFDSAAMQVLLILMVLLFPVIGPLVYFQFKRRFTEPGRKFAPAFKSRN